MSAPVACILVNWNNWQDTAACLASLRQQTYANLTVIVVDNGSTDNSLTQLQAAHPPQGAIPITYIDNGSNAGFSRACNVGAAHAIASGPVDFLWFLNNDTIAPPDTLTKLIRTAAASPQAGIIGSVLYYFHAPQTVQAWGGGTVNRWSAYNTHFTAPATLGPNSYITFASALVRREVFQQLGGLFEGAFMYFEDTDFSLRARAAGWQLAVAADTAILHKEGGSSGSHNLRLDRMVTTSGLIFLTRHAPAPAIARALFIVSRIIKRIVLAKFSAVSAVVQGVADWRRQRSAPPPN